MTTQINGTSGITFSDSSVQNTAAIGFRNRIINGGMTVDQRNAGASVTPTSGAFTVDRWQFSLSQASKLTAAQSSTAPAGFNKSLLITSSSAYTVGATEVFGLLQPIEGLNMPDVGFGAVGASTLTLSFWVRSSLTGTFGGVLTNYANDRTYPFSYTISSANTWEQKSVTITGDTSGTWLTTNSGWGQVWFSLGVGSSKSTTAGSWAAGAYYAPTGATSVVGTNGATFYITGVQLEKGTTASSFDFRSYGTELALCQRYYCKSFMDGTAPSNGSSGTTFSTYKGIVASPFSRPSSVPGTANDSTTAQTSFCAPIYLPVTMRTQASITIYGNSSGQWFGQGGGNTSGSWSAPGVVAPGDRSFTAGTSWINTDSVGAVWGHWVASAEL